METKIIYPTIVAAKNIKNETGNNLDISNTSPKWVNGIAVPSAIPSVVKQTSIKDGLFCGDNFWVLNI